MKHIIIASIFALPLLLQGNGSHSNSEPFSIDSSLVLLKRPDTYSMGKAVSNLLLATVKKEISDDNKIRILPILHSIFNDLPLDYTKENSIRYRVIELLTLLGDSTAGDIFISAYNDLKQIAAKDSVDNMGRKQISWTFYKILMGLSKIGDQRAKSLALMWINEKDPLLVCGSVHAIRILKISEGTDLLLRLMKDGRLPQNSGNYGNYTGPLGNPMVSIKEVMYTLSAIGEPALPYLQKALSDTNEAFAWRVALVVGWIGTDDFLLKKQVGAVLSHMIESRSDSFYLEEAIECMGKLGYRDVLPVLFSLLLDETIIDKPMLSISDFPFMPNRIAVDVLKKFGLPATREYIKEDSRRYEVIEFTDLSGKHHKVMKLLTEKQGHFTK